MDAWRALEAFKAAGKVRSIGVSNFGVKHLDTLAAASTTVPAVNQVTPCACVYDPWIPYLSGCSILAD